MSPFAEGSEKLKQAPLGFSSICNKIVVRFIFFSAFLILEDAIQRQNKRERSNCMTAYKYVWQKIYKSIDTHGKRYQKRKTEDSWLFGPSPRSGWSDCVTLNQVTKRRVPRLGGRLPQEPCESTAACPATRELCPLTVTRTGSQGRLSGSPLRSHKSQRCSRGHSH